MQIAVGGWILKYNSCRSDPVKGFDVHILKALNMIYLHSEYITNEIYFNAFLQNFNSIK